MRYICPVCSRPFTPVQKHRFPVHGRRWTPGSLIHGTYGTWTWCDGVREDITTETKTHPPRPARRRT